MTLTQLDEQGIAERYDIVIDFSRYSIGQKVWMVNWPSTRTVGGRTRILSIAEALRATRRIPASASSWSSASSGIRPARHQPGACHPHPETEYLPGFPWSASGPSSSGGAPGRQRQPVTTGEGPWGIATNGGDRLAANFGRVSAAPDAARARSGTCERRRWLGSPHPHRLRGHRTLARNGSASKVPRRSGVGKTSGGSARTARSRSRCSFTARDGHGALPATHEDCGRTCYGGRSTTRGAVVRPLPTPIPGHRACFQAPDEIFPTAL